MDKLIVIDIPGTRIEILLSRIKLRDNEVNHIYWRASSMGHSRGGQTRGMAVRRLVNRLNDVGLSPIRFSNAAN